MAELLLKPNGSGSRHATPRIDLTPMVDLGFLLLTFFIMTASMRKPKALEVQMPYKGPGQAATVFYESSSVTLMPASDHVVYYYEGLLRPGVSFQKAAGMGAVRDLLHRKTLALQSRSKPDERRLQVLIKPYVTAKADDIVGLFDEMSVSCVPVYAMVDLGPEEQAMLDRQEAGR